MLEEEDVETMTECKHGLRQGCVYCHRPATPTVVRSAKPRRGTKSSRLSEQMNDRMTNLQRRLRQIRGE